MKVNFGKDSVPKLYHIARKSMDGKELEPRIPDNEYIKWGIEDGKTKRVSFASSVKRCLRAIAGMPVGTEMYVHTIDKDSIDDKTFRNHIVYPTRQQVPDVHLTSEVWVTCKVKLKLAYKIRITKIGGKHTFTATTADGKPFTKQELFVRDREYEIIKTPIEEVKEIFNKIKYGLRDPKTNKPWKDTHSGTRWQDYDSEWRLATPEETIKSGIGNCYDTVAISREYLKKAKGIQFRTFFMVDKNGGFMDCPTHTFLIYLDTDDQWKWLEGSWGPFKNNDWSSKNPRELVKWIGTAMANMEKTDIQVFELNGYPKYGCDMTEFETFCRKGSKFMVCKPEKGSSK